MTITMAPPPTIKATPFKWRDPSTIPMRPWLYGHFLIRQCVSMDVAPGGIGKSSHSFVEALAMASGKALLGILPKQQLRVWCWSLEEPRDETDRRMGAAMRHYGIDRNEVEDWLLIEYASRAPLIIAAKDKNGDFIVKPLVDALVAEIQALEIDVVIIDPFVASHRLEENDNSAMDMVIREWSNVAMLGNCAIRLVHHTRKGEQVITAESSRGASAMSYAARVVRVFNRMTQAEAEKLDLEEGERRRHYRTYIDKQNMAPPSDKSDWFTLTSVPLGNGPPNAPDELGDQVGVTTTWEYPESDIVMVGGKDFELCAKIIREGKWRRDLRSPQWVGYAIAAALKLKPDKKPKDQARIKVLIETWLEAGALVEVERSDSTWRSRTFIEVAPNV